MEQEHSKYDCFDWLAQGVLIVSLQGKIVFANTSCETFFGVSKKLLQNRDCFSFISELKNWTESYRTNLSPTFLVQNELIWLKSYPKEPIEVFATVHPLNVSDLLVIELVPAKKTILQSREKHMNELSESNRRLLRNLAHEIKNPLGGIRGAAQLLQSELESAEKREFAEVIISEADRLQNLVDKMLAPYRSLFRPETLNVHEILERVRLLIESEFPVGLKIVRDYDISAPDIQADRGQLTQIFLNLMRNAAEALGKRIPNGDAQINVVTRVVYQQIAGNNLYKSALNVKIIDNGEGIKSEIADSIFYPLVSGKEGGSGLGLSLVQSFVEQHEGSIQVQSQPNRTEFSILFPLKL